MLWLHSFCHLLVDALCAATLVGPVAAAGADAFSMGLLYNTLAFSTQCIVGLLADWWKRHLPCAGAAVLAVVLGAVLPLPAVLRVMLVGMGNSVFHVAAGADVLERSRGKAGPLGIFVAPGAMGLTLGLLFPQLIWVFAAAALFGAFLFLRRKRMHFDERTEDPPECAVSQKQRVNQPVLLCVLLTLAVAIRAVGGTAVVFPWKTGVLPTLLLTFCICLGKAGGGFLCDRIGSGRTALLSLPLSAVLIALCAAWAIPSVAGQMLLNLTMPVTLWLMYRLLPKNPGFAFGLAASALWPGTILGRMLLGELREIWVLICFLFGLFAILFTDHQLKKER